MGGTVREVPCTPMRPWEETATKERTATIGDLVGALVGKAGMAETRALLTRRRPETMSRVRPRLAMAMMVRLEVVDRMLVRVPLTGVEAGEEAVAVEAADMRTPIAETTPFPLLATHTQRLTAERGESAGAAATAAPELPEGVAETADTGGTAAIVMRMPEVTPRASQDLVPGATAAMEATAAPSAGRAAAVCQAVLTGAGSELEPACKHSLLRQVLSGLMGPMANVAT